MKILQITKKGLMFFVLAVFVFAMQFTTIFTFATKSSYAASSDKTSSLIENANFTNSTATSTGKPNNPSNWVSAGGDADSVSKGIIDTENNNFTKNNNYSLDENPSTPLNATDTKVLMINSADSYTRFGYKNNSAIKLDANSYYRLSVACKTDTVTNGASIYLSGTGLANTNQYNFIDTTTNPSVNSGWSTYTFYIRTNLYESASVYLEMWLGSQFDNNITSKGAVFFDNVTINTINQSTYFDYINEYDFSDISNMPENYRNIDLTKNLYSNQFTNSDFESETDLEGWERTAFSGLANTYSGITIAENSSEMLSAMHLSATDAIPGNTGTYGNSKALYINHANEDGAHTEYTSSPIAIKQHSFVAISAYAKTGNIKNGGAYMSVVEDTEEENPLSTKTDDFTSTGSPLSLYNNYCHVVIYVEGNPYRDTNVVLKLGLGSEETKTSGYVVFDDIQVHEITYTEYQAKTSNTLKLYSDSNTSKITNGAFNFSASKTIATYPIAPRNWTLSNTSSGIINVNYDHFNANNQNYGLAVVNPGPVNYKNADPNIHTTRQNVLMLRNTTKNSNVTATSDQFSYEKTSSEDTSSIVAISAYVKVQDTATATKSGAYLSLMNGTYEIARISNIKSADWTKYTIYLEASKTTLSLQLVLGLGNYEDSVIDTYAYFDNVSYTTAISAEEVSSRDQSTTTYTNFSENNFESYIDNGTDVYTPTTMYSTDDISATTAGIIDSSSVSTSVVGIDIPQREGSLNNHLLMIKNNAPTHYSYTANYPFNFEGGSNYVISLWIYTANIQSTQDVEEYGVNISMTNVTDSFKHVVAKTEESETVWTKYSFYISAVSDASLTSTITISLGSEENPAQGYLFVDSITIETIETEEYNKVKADEFNVKTVAKVAVTDEDTDSNTSTNDAPAVNYWILIPSIILAITLIIAIIGIAMRKLNFRLPKFNRNKKSDYNRDLSLNNADIRRELEIARNAKLKELDKQIESTKAEMDTLKKDYEESIKGLESEQKIEKLFTKYAKNNGKLQTQVDNLESAKKYLTDEANIKLEEQREIRKRQLMLEEENRLLQQNQAAIEKEKQKEKEEQKAKEEEGKKKARLKSKK